MRRETPQINAGSMADIAFLLLIFWLVATSLKPERGLPEVLQSEEDKVKIAVPTSNSDILRVYVNEDGEYEVEQNGTRVMDIMTIESLLMRLKKRSGIKAKLIISAHYEAPYKEYLELLDLAEKLKTKTIETEIKDEKEETDEESKSST